MRNSTSSAILEQGHLDPLVTPVPAEASTSKDYRNLREIGSQGRIPCVAESSKRSSNIQPASANNNSTYTLDPFDLLDVPENDPLLAPLECIPSAFHPWNVSVERNSRKRKQIETLQEKLMTHPHEEPASKPVFRRFQPSYYSHFNSEACSDLDLLDVATHDEELLDSLSKHFIEDFTFWEKFRREHRLPPLKTSPPKISPPKRPRVSNSPPTSTATSNARTKSNARKAPHNIKFVHVKKPPRPNDEVTLNAVNSILQEYCNNPYVPQTLTQRLAAPPMTQRQVAPPMTQRQVAPTNLLPVAVKAMLVPEVIRTHREPSIGDMVRQMPPLPRSQAKFVTVPRQSNRTVLAPRQPTFHEGIPNVPNRQRSMFPVKVVQHPLQLTQTEGPPPTTYYF